jgi:hypothetical protein
MHRTASDKALAAETKRKGRKRKTKKDRKFGRNKVKCAKYRALVGRPRGRGVPGNKSGKNKSVR